MSMSKVFDELIGGVRDGDVVGIYAVPSTGKTLSLLYYCKELGGRKVLYIDTEGGVEYFLDEKEALRGLEIEFKTVRSLERFMQMLGRPIEINISKKGRMTVSLEKMDRRKKIKDFEELKEKFKEGYLIIIDSLSSLLKTAIPSDTENLPARANVQALIFGALFGIMDECGKGKVVIVNHASKNPMGMGFNRGELYGGENLKYFMKKIIAIELPSKRVLRESGYRRAWAIRSPYYVDGTQSVWYRITDDGIENVEDGEVEKILLGE